MPQFQLEGIREETVVRNLTTYGVIHHLPWYIQSHLLFIQFFVLEGTFGYRSQLVWFFQDTIVYDQFKQLLLVRDICVCGLQLLARCLVIVTLWHPRYHNLESCIWQLLEGTSCLVAWALSQICHWLHGALLSLRHRLLNHACTCLPEHFDPLSRKPHTIVKIFQSQPVLASDHPISTWGSTVLRFISKPFEMDLPLDNALMLFLQKPCHQYFLPLVECTKVWLPHPSAKLLQGEFSLLQTDWGIAFCETRD